jgi:hypothetical protein
MSGREPLPSPSATELRPSMPGPVPADDGGVTVSDGAKSVRVEAAKASSPGGHDFLRRRKLVVEDGKSALPDRIHDQRVAALVMADRFAIP